MEEETLNGMNLNFEDLSYNDRVALFWKHEALCDMLEKEGKPYTRAAWIDLLISEGYNVEIKVTRG